MQIGDLPRSLDFKAILILCFALIIFIGCDSRNPILTAQVQPEVTSVPIEIQKKLVWTDPDGLPFRPVPYDRDYWKASYYTKYLDVDGIVLVASDSVPDERLQAARLILLTITSKRPELRVEMRPYNGEIHPDTGWATGATRYFALLAAGERNDDLPVGTLGVCGVSCIAQSNKNLTTFIHELGHWIEHAIFTLRDRNFVQRYPDFRRRLETAFTHARALDLYSDAALSNFARAAGVSDKQLRNIRKDRSEYWAAGVVIWYFPEYGGFESRDAFKAYDPELTHLLSEWVSDHPIELNDN